MFSKSGLKGFSLLSVLLLPSLAFAQRWSAETAMPVAVKNFGASSINGKIYTMGGFTSSFSYTRGVYEYDPSTDTWTSKSSLPNIFFTIKSVTIGSSIFAVGDYAGQLRVLEYDPIADSWTTRSARTSSRADYTIAEANGKIYVIGGATSQVLDKVEEYDPASNTWTTKTSMPTARNGAAAATFNGKIYVIGGQWFSGYLDTMEEYDPVLDSWTTKESMPFAKRRLEAQIVEGKLFAIGGYYGIATNLVEEYNFTTNTWKTSDPMLTARESFATAVIGDSLYAIGGQNSSIISLNEVFFGARPPAPTGVIATSGDRRVDLVWDQSPDTDIFEYTVYRNLGKDFFPAPADSVGRALFPDTTFTDSTVLNNTTYWYKISALDTNYNVSDFSSQVSAMPYDTVVPAIPQNVAAQPDDRRVLLSWDSIADTDLKEYIVYRSLTSSFSPTRIDSIASVLNPDSTYIDSSVINTVTYFYKISAVDSSSNESGFSAEVFATPVDTSAPAAPVNLTATGLNESIRLNWDSSPETDLLQYNVFRSQTDGFTPSRSDSIGFVSLSDSTYRDSTVTVGLVYYYRISALDSSGYESPFSNQATAVPIDTVAPAIPQNAVVTAGDRFLDLSWSANTEIDLTHYIIYKSQTNGFTPTSSDSLTLITAPDSTYRDSAVVVGTTYYYRLSAVDTAFNESGFSVQASAVPFDSAPSAPQNLAASNGPGIVTLTWDANTEQDLLKYIIYRNTSPGFTPGLADSIGTIFPPTTSHVDSAGTIEVTYYYKISASDSSYQESSFSNEASGTAFDPTPPAAPQNLIAAGGNSIVNLIWNQNTEPDLKQYVIYRSLSSGFTPTSADSVGVVLKADTTFTDNDVVNNQPYYYKIAATDSVLNYSAFSNEASATPTPTLAYPWQTKTVMPTARFKAVAGVIDGKIYVIGGRIGGVRADDNEEYDPVADTWAVKTVIPSDREDFGGDVVGERIFIVGGNKGGSYYTTNEAYKTTTDTWEILLSMNSERRGLTVTAVNDKLYAIGGRRGNTAFRDDVEEFDPVTNTWVNRTVMPTLRWGHGAAVLNDKIYVIGGEGATGFLDIVEIYDPATDTWTAKTSMPTPRRDLTASTIAGRIYAIGGEDATGYLDIVEVYDPSTDTWVTGDSMLTARSDHTASSLNDVKIYAIGGIDGSGELAINEEYNPPPWQPLNLTAAVEPNQITMNWSANVEPDLSYYIVYRSETDGFAPTVTDVIARVSKDNTTFDDTNIPSATTFYYKISAIDSAGQESRTFSNQVSATTSTFALDLGTVDTFVTNGDTLTIPLRILGNFDGAGIRSFQFTLTYDSVQINGLEIDTTGFGSSVTQFTNIVPGGMKFAAIFPDTLSGSNKTMNLMLEVDDDARRDTTLLQFTDSFFNEGIPIVDLSTTSIRVKPRYGDVSGNNSITSFDASLVLQNVVGLETFSTGRSEKADVTFNGSVTALDAFFILLRATNLISSFPVEDSLFGKISADNISYNVIDLEQSIDVKNRLMSIRIDIKSVSTIASFLLDAQFDESLAQFDGILIDEKYSDYLYVENVDNGTLKFAMTGTPSVISDGTIATLHFLLSENYDPDKSNSLFTLNNLEINDKGNRVSGFAEELINVPRTYELSQNYPNPFNPETTIMYQLPKSSHVILKIYNILGQEVRTLVNEEKSVGYHRIKWDGNNNFGLSVSPGVYFYRIRAESYSKTMKMVIMK